MILEAKNSKRLSILFDRRTFAVEDLVSDPRKFLCYISVVVPAVVISEHCKNTEFRV